MKTVDNINNKVWIHILGWAIFILYELTYLYIMAGTLGRPAPYILNYLLNISLFYFNAHVIFRYTASRPKNKLVVTILFIIIEIILFVLIKYLINVIILGGEEEETMAEFLQYAISNALRSSYFIGFSAAYWFTLLTVKRNQEIGELEKQSLIEQNEKILLQKDLLQSRNAYLQAQVNPHLLFNTLNFMYNTSAKVSEKLAETVMNLSDIMRYALTSMDKDDKVGLEKEINHIHNYIQLNQARFDEKLNIDLVMNGNPNGLRIIPLALITLIENVFKYGDLQDPQNPALISLDIEKGILNMELKNKKRGNRRIHGHGTGIRNLKERLDIYYPNAYSLDINDQENSYQLKLNIILNP